MTTIAIIGANGQVGSEVCLFLSQMSNVKVVPICRTVLASAFLRRCGLNPRLGSIDGSVRSAHLFEDCDLVADFTLPQGKPSAQRKAIFNTSKNAIEQAPGGARYVYISSIMAFGMGGESQPFRRYIMAQTIYGQAKRYGERLVFRIGRKIGREIYILRLGQVHGELQGVSRKILNELRNEPAHIPDIPSYTVFAFTIAEALLNIALGKEEPGRYTLVSVPQWTWQEIYEYYAHRCGIDPRVILLPARLKSRRSLFRIILSYIKNFTINSSANFAIRHRELIVGYILSRFPNIEARMYAIYSRHRARIEISGVTRQKEASLYRPFLPRPGKLPGQRMSSLSDSRGTMNSLLPQVQKILSQACSIDR